MPERLHETAGWIPGDCLRNPLIAGGGDPLAALNQVHHFGDPGSRIYGQETACVCGDLDCVEWVEPAPEGFVVERDADGHPYYRQRDLGDECGEACCR